jgi:hypothetical protein
LARTMKNRDFSVDRPDLPQIEKDSLAEYNLTQRLQRDPQKNDAAVAVLNEIRDTIRELKKKFAVGGGR